MVAKIGITIFYQNQTRMSTGGWWVPDTAGQKIREEKPSRVRNPDFAQELDQLSRVGGKIPGEGGKIRREQTIHCNKPKSIAGAGFEPANR